MQLHQQDTDYYCGCAVAQMMIGPTGAVMPSQDWLYGQLANPLWHAAPDRLATVLSTYLAKAVPAGFAMYCDPDRDAGFARIAASVASGTAVPVVVLDGSHWVTITEVSHGPAEARIGATRPIVGLYYDDPYPKTASQDGVNVDSPPPPHHDGDVCGSGGWYGTANAYESVAGWTGTYWCTPCAPPAVCEPGYVTVCPVGIALAKVRLEPLPGPWRADAHALLDEPRAIESAARGLREHDLEHSSRLASFLRGARPERAALVRRTDAAGAVEVLGRRFEGDEHWLNRLVRVEVDLDQDKIRIYRLRRREPVDQPLLKVLGHHIKTRNFSE